MAFKLFNNVRHSAVAVVAWWFYIRLRFMKRVDAEKRESARRMNNNRPICTPFFPAGKYFSLQRVTRAEGKVNRVRVCNIYTERPPRWVLFSRRRLWSIGNGDRAQSLECEDVDGVEHCAGPEETRVRVVGIVRAIRVWRVTLVPFFKCASRHTPTHDCVMASHLQNLFID